MSAVSCPGCKARLKFNKPVAPGKAITCPKCAKVFRAPAPVKEEAADDPADVDDKVSARKPSAKATKRDMDDDADDIEKDAEEEPSPRKRPLKRTVDESNEEDEDEAPRPRKKQRKGKKQAALFSRPMVLIGIGGAAVAAAVVVVLIMTSGDAGDKKAPIVSKDKPPVMDKVAGDKLGTDKPGPTDKGIGGGGDEKKAPPAAPWKEYRFDSFKFSILMPGKPTDHGSTPTALRWSSEIPEINVTINADQLSAKRLAKGAKEHLKSYYTLKNAKVLGEVTVDGHPGLDFDHELYGFGRVFIVGDKEIQITVDGPGGKINRASAEKVFNSIKVLK